MDFMETDLIVLQRDSPDFCGRIRSKWDCPLQFPMVTTIILPWTASDLMGIIGKICGRTMSDCFANGTTAGNFADRFWDIAAPRIILGMAVVAILVTVAYYVIEKIRPKPIQKERRAHQMLSKFRELHSQGELSDEEFRTIKTTLASQLQEELKDNGEEG
jgi:uncharacterized membrane protein